jgi:hypothetical protein
MDYKAEPSNKKKIYYNYFSHAKKNDISTKSDVIDHYNNPSNEQIENSFTQIKPSIKHVSLDKLVKSKSHKNALRTGGYTDLVNKSLPAEPKTKVNLNFNLNLNVNGHDLKNEKKIEDFLNTNFSKLNDSKLSRIFTKSPLNQNSGNIFNESRSSKLNQFKSTSGNLIKNTLISKNSIFF